MSSKHHDVAVRDEDENGSCSPVYCLLLWLFSKELSAQLPGAIVVDLERNKPIALLADHGHLAVAGWLKSYPTIKIVARDRSNEFAAAITAALPQAKHMADRWHAELSYAVFAGAGNSGASTNLQHRFLPAA